LAKTYKALGKHQESQNLFDKVLKIYDKNYGEENIETARLQRDMAEIYLEKDRLNEAENLIKRSLNILKYRNHVDTYKSLKVLGEIYFKKSIQSSRAKKDKESQDFKNQAINQFNQALKIAEQQFPKHSAHIQRLSSKIKKAQEEKA
jgi:tetratricopeptide (TPR) repeat protein